MEREFELKEIDSVVEDILNFSDGRKIFLFEGPLGAGKTTLIKEISKKLGITHDMSSPSFGIVNVYFGDGNSVYHFDLYRLRDSAEAMDMGIEEYLDSGAYCFVEWPQIALNIFKSYEHLKINLSIQDNYKRSIFVSK